MEKENRTPGYMAYIPSDVRYDKELKPNEKLLFGEISALATAKGHCWATNKYFADLYDVAVETVSRWISHLAVKGYIKTKIVYHEDGKTIKERRITVNFFRNFEDEEEDGMPIDEKIKGIDEKINQPIDEKINQPIDEKIKENNTSINNTSKNNIKENKKRKSESELESDFEELWKLYPRKVGKKDAFKHYKAAIKNGTTNEQIRQGIENYNAWLKAKNETEYIKHGSTFFSKEAWNDDYDLTHVNRGDPFDVRNQYWDENDPTVH